ncbi:MAG: hypothetical protein AB1443_01140 [Pseudomonadota bacterium]
MKHFLFSLALALFSTLASAAPHPVGAPWPGLTLPDQHDKSVTLAGEKLRVFVFAAERKPGDWAQDVIEKSHKEAALAGRLALVFDISRMPSLVTTIFAMPGFRARPFPILLARDKAPVDFLPLKEASVTVLTLEAGKVVAIDYANNEAVLEQLLTEKLK